MKNYLTLILAALMLASCGVTKTGTQQAAGSYKDATVIIPAKQFEENELTKQVIVGSSQNAKDSSCTFMQRYKVTTNQNFTATLNLLKYRAALMGAGRIAIINHEELDAKEEKYTILGWDVAVKEGTALNGADFQTTLIADLFDCSCPTCGCTNSPSLTGASGSVCAPKK
jgi:hypothetical protein